MHIAIGHMKAKLQVREPTIPECLHSAALRLMRGGQKLWLCVDSGRFVAIYSDAELGLAVRACAEYNRGISDEEESEWAQSTSKIWESAVLTSVEDSECNDTVDSDNPPPLFPPLAQACPPTEAESKFLIPSLSPSMLKQQDLESHTTTPFPSLILPRIRATNSLLSLAPPLPVADTMFRVWRRDLERQRESQVGGEDALETPTHPESPTNPGPMLLPSLPPLDGT
jgi:hypothetical protein